MFFDVNKSRVIDILTDIEEHSFELTDTTISELAKSCKNLVELMDKICRSIIGSVECEEHNANLPNLPSHEENSPYIAESPFEE